MKFFPGELIYIKNYNNGGIIFNNVLGVVVKVEYKLVQWQSFANVYTVQATMSGIFNEYLEDELMKMSDIQFDFGTNSFDFDTEEKTEKLTNSGKEYEPDSNVTRDTCIKCGKPTVKKELFSSFYYYCERCRL